MPNLRGASPVDRDGGGRSNATTVADTGVSRRGRRGTSWPRLKRGRSVDVGRGNEVVSAETGKVGGGGGAGKP